MPQHNLASRAKNGAKPPARASLAAQLGRNPHFLTILALACLFLILASLALAVIFLRDSAPRARQLAETATRAGRWPEALSRWRIVNASDKADSFSFLQEAKACLALGRAGQAARALEQSSAIDPSQVEPWLIRLEITRIENRLPDAISLGQRALAAVSPTGQREILRGLTLALLAEAPDDLARATLQRWIDADPTDLNARAALERRRSENPRSSDPHVAQRRAALERLVAQFPSHVGLRESLVLVLAEAGDPANGRLVLDAWPPQLRDARYHRLRGRWDLEYDNNPRAAEQSLKQALVALPHDTKTRYRLARALQATGQFEDARQVSATDTRIREILEPVRLARRLDGDLANLDDPSSRKDLAELCQSVGLINLAQAWRADAKRENGPKNQHIMTK